MVAPIRCLEASWVIGLHVEYRSRHHVPPSIPDSGLGDWLGLTMERDRYHTLVALLFSVSIEGEYHKLGKGSGLNQLIFSLSRRGLRRVNSGLVPISFVNLVLQIAQLNSRLDGKTMLRARLESQTLFFMISRYFISMTLMVVLSFVILLHPFRCITFLDQQAYLINRAFLERINSRS